MGLDKVFFFFLVLTSLQEFILENDNLGLLYRDLSFFNTNNASHRWISYIQVQVKVRSVRVFNHPNPSD